VEAITRSRPDEVGKTNDSFRDELGVLDNVRGVADDPRQDQVIVGELDVLPDVPFVLIADAPCAYRLCHPNVVPMETAEPSD
jgi:hypothetical protein